ncbi:hypothetical protein HK096_000196, partial [Nowakowskiella sp. JEL0078]
TAALIGGPVGGFFADFFSWRYAFLINIPLGILVIIVVVIYLEESSKLDLSNSKSVIEKVGRIDYLGVITLVTSTTLIVLGLSLGGNEYPWSHPIVLWSLAGGVALFFVFGIVEKFFAYEPVVPLRILAIKTPLACYMFTLFANMASFALIFLVPLFFAAFKLESATSAGIHLIPKIVATSSGSFLTGLYMTMSGKYKGITIFSLIVMFIADIFIAVKWDEKTTEIEFFSSLVLDGAAFGVTLTTGLVAMLAALPPKDIAVGSALIYTFRAIGSVLGVAGSQTAFQAALKNRLHKTIVGPDSET